VAMNFLKSKVGEYEEIKRQIKELSVEIEGKEGRVFFQRKCWRPWTEYPEEFSGVCIFTKRLIIRNGYTIHSPVTEGAELYLSEDNDLSLACPV